ncbi:AfsR/SARP family transcriptional regulator [Actinosynnema sp. ALI-1.44]|uniref:AfsR/SARP family transcriptional regulator n=1 Tax=Actinosynnema sp. ALI-1.44 TaxID=1933779 RepID=UPI00143CDD3E|nr:BTAD domain-containing putative transcriptional regulator [Actinosynnema sp. ALI-1.44]
MSSSVEINVLGPWQAFVGGRPVVVQAGHQRTLLSSLVLSAGQPVMADTLAGQVWGDQQPVNVRGALSTYATRLRAVFGKDAIVANPGGGYCLSVDQDNVDLHRFRRLLRQARGADSARTELGLLREALGLWRGRPFTGVESDWLDMDVVPSLTEEWFTATERRIDLDLAVGASSAAIAELSGLTTQFPLRESLWLRLIDAMWRTGRRADALSAYRRVRSVLRDELGVEPDVDLQRLHRELLRDIADERVTPLRASAAPGPHELPPDNVRFVGRRAELATLDDLVATITFATGAGEPPTIVVAIDGAPGTGKTALALHWAHRMAHRHPDTQLYLNLRGYSAEDPVRPAAAVETMLRSLGVPIERIPAELDERSALLRSTLAGRKPLMLLDNARDAAQVRALLPGAGGLVIVTSRNQLRSLSIRDGAQRLSLQRLSHDDAVELLGSTAGTARVAAEPQAAGQLAELCEGLPLALAIVAERAQRTDTLSHVVQALTDEMGEPAAFRSGMGSELYAALSWSYRALDPLAATMFRKLGLHPANDISTDAAAVIVDLPSTRARQVLDQLHDAHMVEQLRPKRYELHDLIRLYAAEEAHRTDSPDANTAAIRRVLDWYLHTAVSAESVLQPRRRFDFVAPLTPAVPPVVFADQAAATGWFEREFDCLRSVVRWAATHGWGGHAWRIVIAMTTFLDRRVAWQESVELLETALAAARAAEDRVGEGYAFNSLSCQQIDKNEFAGARRNLEQAIDCFVDTGHQAGETMALSNLGLVHGQAGEPERGLQVCASALALAETLGYQRGVANNHNNMATAHVALGDYDKAIDCFRRADRLFAEIGDIEPRSLNLQELGRAYATTGQHTKAIRALRRAAAGYGQLGNRRWQAIALYDLGNAIACTGHPGWARHCWHAALVVMRELADPRTAELEELLEAG